MKYNNLDQAIINKEPVANVIVDDFFEESFLKKTLDYFPIEELNNDFRGNSCFFPNQSLSLLQKDKNFFWTCFFSEHLPIITKKLAIKFETLIGDKFKNLVKLKKDFVYGSVMLSQNRGDDLDFCPHYHFNNDPLWFMTVLIYLDGEQNNAPGTTFYTLNENIGYENYIEKYVKFNELRNNNELTYEDQTNMINKHLSDFKKTTVEFKNNRLFCFLDTFTSIHSVEYVNMVNNSLGQRKSIRFHVGFDRNTCNEVYGFAIDDFNNRMNTPINEEVRKIFRQEIKFLNYGILKKMISNFKKPKFPHLNVEELKY